MKKDEAKKIDAELKKKAADEKKKDTIQKKVVAAEAKKSNGKSDTTSRDTDITESSIAMVDLNHTVTVHSLTCVFILQQG